MLASLALLSSAIATPSWAQDGQAAASEESESVTVTGQREPPPSLGTEILRFVRGHARLSRIDQLARWREPICLRVMNLPVTYGNFIMDRIKSIAREAGAATNDQEGCAPNVSIMFTTEPQSVLDNISSENPQLLGYHFITNRRALATMTRPIQGWYVTATRSGVITAIDESMHDPPAGALGSRLTHDLESIFVHVLILVNANLVADTPIGPIADYLAVLSLTEIRDEAWECGGLVTIMEHFTEGCGNAPQELTRADRAFLRGLYSMDGRAVVSLQRAHIRSQMSRTVRDEEADTGATSERQDQH